MKIRARKTDRQTHSLITYSSGYAGGLTQRRSLHKIKSLKKWLMMCSNIQTSWENWHTCYSWQRRARYSSIMERRIYSLYRPRYDNALHDRTWLKIKCMLRGLDSQGEISLSVPFVPKVTIKRNILIVCYFIMYVYSSY